MDMESGKPRQLEIARTVVTYFDRAGNAADLSHAVRRVTTDYDDAGSIIRTFEELYSMGIPSARTK